MFGRMKSATHNFVMAKAKAVGNVVSKTKAASSGSGKKAHPKPSQSASASAGPNTSLKINPGLTAQNRKSLGKDPKVKYK